MLDSIPHSDFWALQEAHLPGRERMAAAQRWGRRKGWAAHFQAAEVSGQHEAANRGGVAIGGPLHISSRVPANFDATIMDDAAFMAPAGAACTGVLAQSHSRQTRPSYAQRRRHACLGLFEPGMKASGLNLWLLEVLAACCLGFEGPWTAMGDWNMELAELAQAGWVDLVGGKVFATATVTCAGGGWIARRLLRSLCRG